ncbi:LysR family transcriptional regulator [Burkholderia stagnalis]|uniref:LysR family transcriptional regulator n=1 Tax=Burkholderia stagnalis TaxID=1503054 RepID=UPI0007591E1E|nr:LysR family transcriptional regulator [Burkholderia stagnalis]KVM99812.1 LysR family transcriptional regulator [Burkholderia stagnalis]KWE01971.1 LysR family transcriptional regulator [Burkholderia stagnalis]KWE13902.1 LysR family transcriptional regulator [Burkholderia stagnalis]KWO82075.1 LysR family transcriptional regulator [Burkholderia stagnalis]
MESTDLNLLLALDAMLTEGSVTGAAERLNLSVPAMSRTLNRARKMVGDPLFVRAGRGLVPTPRAEALREGVHDVIQQATLLLRKTDTFDFKNLRRTFTIRADDGAISTIGPDVLNTLKTLAPLVTLRFTAQGRQDVVALREGMIDLDIGVIDDLGPEIVRQTLLHDHFVAVFRASHPLAKLKRLSPKEFVKYDHVTVSRRGLLNGPVDIELGKHGLSRRIQAVAPTFMEALSIARYTDLVATVASRLTQNARADMESRELPVVTPHITISQAWHPRFQADPGHRALRTLIHRICQSGNGRTPPAR